MLRNPKRQLSFFFATRNVSEGFSTRIDSSIDCQNLHVQPLVLSPDDTL